MEANILVAGRLLNPTSSLRRDAWGQLYPIFVVGSPNYTEGSSGGRALFYLCHLLNCLGYEAYVTGQGAPAPLFTPQLTVDDLKRKRASGRDDVVIYPETVEGNPLAGRRVVRYLLNKPGFFAAGMADYGRGDFFAHFAEEFCPPGLISQPLPLPVVDTGLFRPAPAPVARSGFVLYEYRARATVENLPDWLHPWTLASMARPRTALEMAGLYQRSEALVLWERTAALVEALHCGCPVIIAPDSGFDYAPVLARFGRHGIAVGWDVGELQRAKGTVGQFAASYAKLYERLDDTVHVFVEAAMRHFRDPRRGRRSK